MDGKTIREVLQADGRTLADLADFLGVSPQNLNGMLGKDNIKTGTLEGVARFLGKPISFFYNEGSIATVGHDGTAQAGCYTNDSTLIEEIAAQRRLTAKAMEQNSQLLTIIENLTKK